MPVRSFILLLCFVGAAALLARAERPEPAPARRTFASFPLEIAGWRGVPDRPFSRTVLAVLGVDDYLARTYVRASDKATVGVYVGYYGSQRQGDTMHSPQNCLPGSGWEPVSNTRASFEVGGRIISVNRYVIRKGLERQIVLYWYQSHGRVIASEYAGKFYLVHDAVRLNRTDGALVRVTVPVVGDDPETRAQGEARADAIGREFIAVFFSQLTNFIPV